ncbi:hypothetical protein RDI58_015200 [Solanum bulbocastanum]|uniref:Transposase MuDR plant domain-containing protein n=1 Tax=Solanum bulbocastanum TaxID=147425 RepID=A0AAN8TGH8_SOLBU
MIFESAVEFRKAIADYGVRQKVQLKIKPNEPHRVRVRCVGKCNWEIFASLDKDTGNFSVKNYYPVHRCPTKNMNRLCSAKYVERKMRERIISQPDIRVHKLQETIRKKWGLKVGRSICYRAKMNVINKFLGDWKLEFSKLLDYADMIKSTNPGTSCWVRTDNETVPGKYLFKYFYVCFGALKNGWLEAWAVVDQETKHSWSWFLSYLIQDLQLGDGNGITIMSDMQKGLDSAVDGLLPNVERRMCARHIWANWQKIWRGEARRKAFWRCSKASFEVKLSDQFAYLGQLGDNICESLLKYNKEYWCRAFFSERTKCDVVENNMCETFNSWIVGPRHKSVISMLEDIRHKMMDRHGDMIKFVDTWISDISPMARLTLEINKEIGRKLKPSQQPRQQPFQQPYQQPFQQPRQQLSQPSVSQSSTQHSTSLCPETSRVEGRKKQTNSSSTRASSSFGRKSRRDVGFGVYTDIQSGRQVINPGRSSDRVISSGTTLKDASQTNVDLGFKPPGLKWKGKEAITGNQLQQMQQRKKIQIKSKWVP